MQEKKINQSYSKQLPIIIAVIIFLIVVAVFLPKVASKDDKNVKSSIYGSEIEVVESDNLIPDSQSNSSGIQSGNMGENLGAAKIEDILGSESESEEFYGQPNTEKMLEGKDIEAGE